MRPATPRLILLDDGESMEGEVMRLREQVTVVGRNDGQVRLPHDPLVSGKHAEIVREGSGTASRWILRDLGSSNGTFVCCSKTVLRPDRLIILGSRRYRFRLPQPATKPATAAGPTQMVDTAPIMDQMWPALVETTQPDSNAQILLAGMALSVGRPGCGHRIELDDPFIAAHHAEIRRESSGDWVIEAKPSRNGIWVQIRAIRLSEMCRFQCGEQRFLFVV
jgi:pSer/pThr/pTyr-binding forkhead associated (FHA) protein